MTVANNALRLGSVYNATGVALQSGSYDFGSVFFAARSPGLTLVPKFTASGAGAGITSFKIEVMASLDGTNFDLLQTIDVQLANQQIEQTYPVAPDTLPAGGVTKAFGPLKLDPSGYPGGLKVGVKVAGVPAVGDNVTVDASM